MEEVKDAVKDVEARVDGMDGRMDDFDQSLEFHRDRIGDLREDVNGMDGRVAGLLNSNNHLVEVVNILVGQVTRMGLMLQHGPANPIIIEDSDEESDDEYVVPPVAAPLYPPGLGGGEGELEGGREVPILDVEEGRLIPIDEGEPPAYDGE